MAYTRKIKRRIEKYGGGDWYQRQLDAASGLVRSKAEQRREAVWRSKFSVQPIIYRAQYGLPRDVRTFLFDISHILDTYVKHYGLKGANDNETMYKILMWVMDHMVYTGDQTTKSQSEFWQDPEETVSTLRGDCEDGAILIKSLSIVAGVPDWKVKIMAGAVVGGGHAYCTYIRDDDTQCILDWCYWPNRLPINQRPKRQDESNYMDVWFSFDRLYGYAPTAVEYSTEASHEEFKLDLGVK
jgi:predicted transglutaminase-like cysteine proteinase